MKSPARSYEGTKNLIVIVSAVLSIPALCAVMIGLLTCYSIITTEAEGLEGMARLLALSPALGAIGGGLLGLVAVSAWAFLGMCYVRLSQIEQAMRQGA